jgi:hypothetical protein
VINDPEFERLRHEDEDPQVAESDDTASQEDEATAERTPPTEQEPNVWMREGADAPDAADIEDPETQA